MLSECQEIKMGIGRRLLQDDIEIVQSVPTTVSTVLKDNAYQRAKEPGSFSLSEIKRRNITSYELVETDIDKIVRCLLKKNFEDTEQDYQDGYVITSAISVDDTKETVMAQCESIPDVSNSTGIQKIAIPFQRPGHWNLVTVDINESEKKAVVRWCNTDGKAYPLEEKILSIIKHMISMKREIEKNSITTIEETEKHYSFEGQRGVNCGIVTACMIFDYVTKEIIGPDEERELNENYANIIHEGMSDLEIRDSISELLNTHGDDKDIAHFCRDSMTLFHGGGLHTEYAYNSENSDEREIYNCLKNLSTDSFMKVNNAIDDTKQISEQIATLRSLYTNEKVNIKGLFRNEDLELREHWRDLIIYISKEKTQHVNDYDDKSEVATKFGWIRKSIVELFKSSTFQYLLCLIIGYYFFGITGCICTTMGLFTIKTYIQENQIEMPDTESPINPNEAPVQSGSLLSSKRHSTEQSYDKNETASPENPKKTSVQRGSSLSPEQDSTEDNREQSEQADLTESDTPEAPCIESEIQSKINQKQTIETTTDLARNEKAVAGKEIIDTTEIERGMTVQPAQ